MNKEYERKGNERKENVKEVKEVTITMRNPFKMKGVLLCVAVALSASVPAFAINAILHQSPKKETYVMFCQFNGGLLGISCN